MSNPGEEGTDDPGPRGLPPKLRLTIQPLLGRRRTGAGLSSENIPNFRMKRYLISEGGWGLFYFLRPFFAMGPFSCWL